jgi:predicted GNAT family N-acyltransferase
MSDYHITKAKWPEDAELLRKLREQVFVIGQRVDPHIEWDGKDKDCSHVLILDKQQQAIATGRLEPSGKLGRIAVIMTWRGKGLGSIVVNQLIEFAKEQGRESLYLNSQSHALEFYEKFGFIPKGHVFMEAGIPHQRMELDLTKLSSTITN